MDKVKSVIGQLVDIGLALIAVAIVATVLFGASNLPFFGGVVNNLIMLVDGLGKAGLVGLIALGIIVWLFAKRSPG